MLSPQTKRKPVIKSKHPLFDVVKNDQFRMVLEPGFKQWLEGFALREGTSMSALAIAALKREAKARRYPSPPS